MILVMAGGKKTRPVEELILEYGKRLKKPYVYSWQFLEEEKFLRKLATWPFDKRKQFVMMCDERGEILSSPEFSVRMTKVLANNRDIVILIGGAYGFSPEMREKADFLWSFSKLVFPHRIAQMIVAEQIYRAQEIALGHPYHHG